MNKLEYGHPPPYTHFIAYDSSKNIFFKNYLIKSEFNCFYLAGKRFDQWTMKTN